MACWAAFSPLVCILKHLGIVCYESGSMSEALARLLQNGRGAPTRLAAKHKALMCALKSLPMMRRPFDAVVLPVALYGCKVWAPACSLALVVQPQDMQGIQISFLCQLYQLCKSVTPQIIFRKIAERPWLDSRWYIVLAVMRRLLPWPESSLHLDPVGTFFKTTLQMRASHWAAGVDKRFRHSLSLHFL